MLSWPNPIQVSSADAAVDCILWLGRGNHRGHLNVKEPLFPYPKATL